jgi:hypothetical protein
MSAHAAAAEQALALRNQKSKSRSGGKSSTSGSGGGGDDDTTDIHQNDSRHGGPTGAARQAKRFAETILPCLLICERLGHRLLAPASSTVPPVASAIAELACYIRRGLLQLPTPNFALTLSVNYRFAGTGTGTSTGAAHITVAKLTIHADVIGTGVGSHGVRCGQNVDQHTFIISDSATAVVPGVVERCVKCWPVNTSSPAATTTTTTTTPIVTTDTVDFGGIVTPLPAPFVPLPVSLNTALKMTATA